MNKLDEGIKLIQEAFKDDFIEKLKKINEEAINQLENKFCLCGDNRNHHENGEGGSPSKCQVEDCLCADYHFSLIKSLFADRDEFLRNHNSAMDYPYIKLMVAIQYLGFNSELLDILDTVFTWSGDPEIEKQIHNQNVVTELSKWFNELKKYPTVNHATIQRIQSILSKEKIE